MSFMDDNRKRSLNLPDSAMRRLFLAVVVFACVTFEYCTSERSPLDNDYQNKCESDGHGVATAIILMRFIELSMYFCLERNT